MVHGALQPGLAVPLGIRDGALQARQRLLGEVVAQAGEHLQVLLGALSVLEEGFILLHGAVGFTEGEEGRHVHRGVVEHRLGGSVVPGERSLQGALEPGSSLLGGAREQAFEHRDVLQGGLVHPLGYLQGVVPLDVAAGQGSVHVLQVVRVALQVLAGLLALAALAGLAGQLQMLLAPLEKLLGFFRIQRLALRRGVRRRADREGQNERRCV